MTQPETTQDSAPASRLTPRRIIIQSLAALVGLGLLAWCIHIALSEKNRPNIEKILHAPPSTIASLLGLSLATLFLNATTFWTAIFPVRRVPFMDIQATNAGAALCNYVPFKLGAMLRFLVHNRRNGVPLVMVGAWIGAVSLTMMVSLIPLMAAAAWRKHIDTLFVAALAGGLILCYAVTLALASAFAHEHGLARLHAIAARLRIKLLDRMLRSKAFANLHAGIAMLAHPVGLGSGMLLRIADLLVQTARFAVAAKLVGIDLGFESALLISSVYFLTSVLSPAGVLGTREGAATAIAAAIGIPDFNIDTFLAIVMTVTASEMVVYLVCGPIGLLYVRPDRLLHGQPSPARSTTV